MTVARVDSAATDVPERPAISGNSHGIGLTTARRIARRETVFVWSLRLVIVVLGAVEAWVSRLQVSPDSIAYLDVSDHFLRAGLTDPHNGYWSPLYPAILALTRRIFGEGPAREWQLAHLANFFLFLLAFLACELLLRALMKPTREPTREPTQKLSDELWFRVFGYLLFAWAALDLTSLGTVTPDMGVLALVLAAASVVVTMSRGTAARSSNSMVSGVSLGVLLGLAYLMKAVMFPIALVFIAVLGTHLWRHHRRIVPVVVALAAFAAIAAPHVVVVSRIKGSPTFGETGRLNYAWFVAHVPTAYWYIHMPDAALELPRPLTIDAATGISSDTATALPATPQLYNLDAPIPGTLPAWYDATYWYPHLAYRIPLRRQAYVTRFNLGLMLGVIAPFILVVAVVVIGWPRRFIQHINVMWTLVLPAMAALALYSLVYVERRYLGGFLMLVLLGFGWSTFESGAAAAGITQGRLFRFQLRNALLVAAILEGGAAFSSVLHEARRDHGFEERQVAVAHQVAALVGPGARVAVVGSAFEAYWARLVRARVVAFVPPSDMRLYWSGSEATRQSIADSLKSLRVALIVADWNGSRFRSDTAGWLPVPGAPGYLTKRP